MSRFDAFDDLSDRRARKSDVTALKSHAKASEAAAKKEYEDEQKAERQKAQRKQKPAAARRHSRTSRAARRVTRPITAGAAQGLRDVQQPVQQSVASGVSILILTLGVIALYQFLNNAQTVNSGIQGLQKGLSWLLDPSKSIAYAA